MRFDVITLFPELFGPFLEAGVTRRAYESRQVDVRLWALRDFAERSDLEALRTLSTFVEQSRRFGSSMAETLQTHADMLRTQREQRAEERAQRAAVKILFPTLLFIFPPILVVLAGPAAIQLQEKFSTSAEELEKSK